MTDDTSPGRGFSRRAALAGMGVAGLFGRNARAQLETIRRGGTLNIMLALDAKSLDPLFGNATVLDRKIFNLYAESLIEQHESGELRPWLAERWEVAPDGLSVTFHLRPGVTFQDGTAFDAAAAKFNLDRLLDPKAISQSKQYVTEMKAVEAVDPQTIRVHLSNTSAPFLAMMGNEPGIMISPTALKERGEKFALSPVGTGPFVVVARATGSIEARRFEGYWRKGADGKPLPYLDGVKMSVNPNSSARLVQVMSGTAQLCDPVSSKDFQQVRANPDLALLDWGGDDAFVLSFNITRPPLDNIDLRKALCLGIDREVMARVVTGGTGGALRGIEPPSSWVYDATLRGHVRDVAAAKALYAKSGYSGPLRLAIVQRDPDSQVAEMMQQMLKQVGVDLRIEVLERTAFLAKVGKFDYDICLSRSLPTQRPDPDIQYAFAYSRLATFNYSGFKNDHIFDLVAKAHAELDQQKRKALYVEIQQLVLDNYFQTFLFWSPTREVASRKLRGIRHDATSVWRYEDMWLAS